MSKHTPGPWEFDGQSRIDAVALRKPTGHTVTDDDGTEREYIGGLVALAYSCGDGTHEGNSRLIAAAPDMLEALQADAEADQANRDHDDLCERAYGEGWDNDPTGSSHISSSATRLRQLRERAALLKVVAIAKATGETA